MIFNQNTALAQWALCLIPFTCFMNVQAEQTFRYDSNGNLLASGGASYTYDGNNQLIRITYSEGKEIAFTYDACGNKTEMKDARGTTRFSYDALGRVILTTYPGGHAVRYAYDARGNLSTLIYPDGEEISYSYDEASRLIETKDRTGITKYEYAPLTQLLKKTTLPNKITIEYTYDEENLVASVTYKSSKGQLMESTAYAYDLNHQVIKTETKTPKETVTAAYTYDRLNRPLKIVYSDGRFEGYNYDAFGNCLSKATEKGMSTYQYDADNRLIKSDDTEFFYDTAGNLIKKISPLGETLYEYDTANQLVQYTIGDHAVAFEYDGNGTRVAKTVNGVRTIFIDDLTAAQPTTLMELSSDQKGQRPLVKKYRYGLSRVSQQIEDDIFFYLQDPVTENVSFLVTSNERKTNRYEYDMFGNKKNSQRSLENPFGFCSASVDSETGLMYIDGRYYDPQIGRFLTKDLNAASLYTPQQLNPYAYRSKSAGTRIEPKDESYKIALRPNFQGIAHQKTAQFMAEITDLEGIVLDRDKGQLILFGADKPGQDPLSLDDLYFALAHDEKIGVYTDDSLSDEVSHINYIGTPSGSHLSHVFYEADRLIKNLSVGIDNLSGDDLSPSVEDYETLLDRCLAHDLRGMVTHEHWLFPEQLSLLASTDNSALLVNELKMAMISDSAHNNTPLNHSATYDYRSHFITHFDQFSQEYPVLGTLGSVEKLIGIGKWAQKQNLLIDWSLFNPSDAYETPDETGIFLARKNKFPDVVNGPKMKSKRRAYFENHYLTIAETGGILCDFNSENLSVSSSPVVDDLKNSLLQARPSETTFSWKAGDYTAVAHTLYMTPKLGNLKKSFTDMSFPVLGRNRLELTRTYNAFTESWEWTSAALRTVAMGMVLVDQGQEFLYSQDKDSPSGYRSSQSPFALVKNGDGSFVLDKRAHGSFTFDAQGRLTKITDLNGISIHYQYANDYLVTIRHQNGRSIDLFYKEGKLCRASGPGGKTLYYKHNDKGQLSSVADRRWPLSSYGYDEQGRLASIFDAKDQLVDTISYDIYNRAIQENDETRAFNLVERTVKIQNPLNLVTQQAYDEHYRLVRSVDSQNRSLQLFYKEGGQAPEKVIDSLGNATLYDYDASGNLISTQDALGNTYRFAYDSQNNLISYENPKGDKVCYHYDGLGRLHATDTGIRYIYDLAGNLTAIIDAQGNPQSFTYDEQGMLIESRSATGFVVTRTYDDRSRLTRVADSSGAFIDYSYDDRDQLITKGNETYTYDDNGNLERVRDGNGYETAYRYDVRNNLIQVTDAEGGITRYEYDLMNHLTKVTFPNGSASTFSYDAAGQKLAVR